jgi:hypothetical protein
MKPQLVPDWRLIWRHWSFRLGVIGTALTSLFLAVPDLALQVWLAMPDDLKAVIPQRYMPFVGVAIMGLSFVAKFIKQAKLEAMKSNGN